MQTLELNVDSEYGKLESVIVHDASTLLPPSQLITPFIKGKLHYNPLWFVSPSELPKTIKKLKHLYNILKGYDAEKVREQLKTFHELLDSKSVSLVPAENVDYAIAQFFTRDLGFVIGNVLYFSVLKHGMHKLGQKGINFLKEYLPASRYVELTEGTIEGGDVFVHWNKVFVGVGSQTSLEGFYGLEKNIKPRGYDAIPILCDKSILHLDCRFNITSLDKAVLSKEGIYPDSVTTLNKHFKIEEIPKDELKTLGPNYLMISPTEAVVDKCNPRTNDILSKQGITLYELDFSEVTKLWGKFRCTTFPLYRR